MMITKLRKNDKVKNEEEGEKKCTEVPNKDKILCILFKQFPYSSLW